MRKTAAGSPQGARGGEHQPRLHAIAFTPDDGGIIATDLHANLKHLQKRIKALQQSAAQLAACEPGLAVQVERLCSAPGIDELDPRPRQSGAADAPGHISRPGNRHLRLALFMPALVAIQRCPNIKASYEALLARGKKEKSRPRRHHAPPPPRPLGMLRHKATVERGAAPACWAERRRWKQVQ